jgi:hypothetical protein
MTQVGRIETGDQPEIRVVATYYAFKVMIGDLCHVRLDRQRFVGFQSWREGPCRFCIEYTLQGGDILTEYDTIEKWRAVLCGLEKVLP